AGGQVVALTAEPLDPATAGSWGADLVVTVEGAEVEEDTAAAFARWCAERVPWAVLAPSTMWGREVAARMAARLDAGLVADAVELAVDAQGRLVCWKPAFGGGLVAEVTCRSPIQMATVRGGVLPLFAPRIAVAGQAQVVADPPRGRVHIDRRTRDDDIDALTLAQTVVAVGRGVPQADYPLLRPLLDALGAELAATRKVTDQGWQPRSRQVGITGRSVTPRLFVAIGASGKFNHMAGARGAGFVLAINSDRAAPVFESSDVGIVADWRQVLPRLVDALTALSAGTPEGMPAQAGR
ncbi:MAG TPA: electron transfer flavoprotein subunit alpha/FixB family protein, partial [Mycobacteriales bacterium]